MADVRDAVRRAARRGRGDESSAARLAEIVGILRRHDIRAGLTPEKAVAILEDLGTTFVKLGQIASGHPDMLPKEYCDAFAALRANVSPMPAEVVRERVEAELGRPVDELFSSFDDHALGSASVAQVHRATLRENGAVVAVKVQRPGVVERVASDLALMRHVVDLYEYLSQDDGGLSFKALVDELERTSLQELDFANEERNVDRFWRNNHDRPGITSPRCYARYSTHAILTMDFATGARADDAALLGALTDRQREDLGYRIAHNYLCQMLDDGFFHADPHAGNILLRRAEAGGARGDAAQGDAAGEIQGERRAEAGGADGGDPGDPGVVVEWIDFGLRVELSSRDRATLRRIIMDVGKRDSFSLKRHLMQMVRPSGAVDHAGMLDACDSLLATYLSSDLQGFDTAGFMNDLSATMRSCGFELPPGVTMLGRGLVTLEGTIRLISDKVSIMRVLTTYIGESVDAREVSDYLRELATSSADSVQAMAAMPSRITETLEMLQRGQVRLEANMGIDQGFRRELTSVARQFSYAIMAAGLFVGSCILCATSLQPRILGVPLLGLVGFASGLALAAYTLVDIRRGRRRHRP